jgi:3-phytase
LHFARELSVPSHPEGVVAGDELGLICMSEEDGGLWRFDAKPDADPAGYLVGAVGSACLPEDDLGVLTIIKTADDGGYVLASA